MSKILIIEDDEKLRKELKIFLEKNGYEVVILENFENTIEDALNEKPDLILLDINLPYFDGEYICKEIRKTSDVPIIIVTSRDSEIDELISLNNGADQYVTKPYNIQILLAKISGLLKRSKNVDINQSKLDCGKFILNISMTTMILLLSQRKQGTNYTPTLTLRMLNMNGTQMITINNQI